MKKSVKTRFKITKNKKVLRRKMAQCHFRAKKSSKQIHRISRVVKSGDVFAQKIIKKPGTL
jgi:ribosomal protein L35